MPTTITISDSDASDFVAEHLPEVLDRHEELVLGEYRQAAIRQALDKLYGEDWTYSYGGRVFRVERPEHLAGDYTLDELEKRLGVFVDPDYMSE